MGCMRGRGGCGDENGQELIWVNFFAEELISVISRLDLSWIASAPIVPRHVKRYNLSQSLSLKSYIKYTYRMRT